MKKYNVTLSTIYGSLTVEDVEANSEKEAEKKATLMIVEEFENYSKVDEIYEQ